MELENIRVRGFSPINRIFIQKYERYLPTAFDESMSLLEKMNKMINGFGDVIDAVDSHRQNTNEFLEEFFDTVDDHLQTHLGEFLQQLKDMKLEYEQLREDILNDILPTSVTNKLEEWLNDGTFDEYINGTIFAEFSERLRHTENRLESVSLSVKDFGAMGDNTVSSLSIQEAIDYVHDKGGGEVIVPPGEYIIDRELEPKAGVHLKGSGRNTIFHRDFDHPIGTMFRAEGSVEPEIITTENVGFGDETIPLISTEGLQSGDYIRIMSQRVAVSSDAGEHNRLGVATSGKHRVMFGEFKRIHKVHEDSIEIVGGLLFPDYLTHSGEETDPRHRPRTTVQKVNFIEDVKISGIKIDGYLANAMSFKFLANSVIEDVEWINSTVGNLVSFRDSYNCEGRHLVLEYHTSGDPATISRRNGFKTVSSYNCGFVHCEAHFATQPFDFTYDTSGDETIPNIYGYVKDCKTFSCFKNPVTYHGGTYGGQVIDNQFIECRDDGISTRARNTLISGNLITGSKGSGSKGVSIYQGSAHDVIVTNNIIKGFNYGLSTGDDMLLMKYCGLVFTNNIVQEVALGVRLDRRSNTKVNAKANVTISGNTFTKFYGNGSSRGIYISNYWRDIHIFNNRFIGNDSTNSAIFAHENSFEIHVGQNSMTQFGSATLWFLGMTAEGKAYFDDVLYHQQFIHPSNYTTANIKDSYVGSLDMGSIPVYTHLRPHLTRQSDLGLDTRRYRRLYLDEQPNVASDEALKSNVEPITNGLEFINALKPSTYTLTHSDSDSRQSGLIAQDVERALSELNMENLNLHQKGEDGQSLVYNELLPYIINALQDLYGKIENK